MEAARHDSIAWTDDDVHHPPNWLEKFHADYERHGPVTELPVFVGRDLLSVLLEPRYVLGGRGAVYTGTIVWGEWRYRWRSTFDVEVLQGPALSFRTA